MKLKPDYPITIYLAGSHIGPPPGTPGLDDLLAKKEISASNVRAVTADLIITNEAGTHILLVHRAPGKAQGDKWALVGGYVDLDETISSAIIREAQEEAGLQIAEVALWRVVDNPNRHNETGQNITFVFVGKVKDPVEPGETPVSDPDGGIDKAAWFPVDGLPPEGEWAFDHYDLTQIYLSDQATTPLSSIFISN